MVEYSLQLDNIFGALSDPTRRDILQRTTSRELTVNEVAGPYDLTLAAISKHLKILEQAKLIVRRRQGRKSYVRLDHATLRQAEDYLEQYGVSLSQRLDRLDQYINREK